MDTPVTARTLRITRHIPAVPAEVFAAWTQPERVKAWFGPYGMSVPECEIELREGGFHRTLMRDAAGKDYPNRMEIDAMEAPHRLVLRVAQADCGPLIGSIGTLSFTADGEGTRFEAAWHHPSEEMRAAHEAMGFRKGWGETLDKLVAHLLPASACPGVSGPTPRHGWLHRLLGEWRYETECTGPDGVVMRASGTERVRSLGGQWVIAEAEGGMPGLPGPARWILTMGFDAVSGRFKGSWVGSMMPQMWIYDGALDEESRILTLGSEGPSFTGEGSSRYRDIVELIDDDTRLFASEVQGEDGAWTRFMKGTYRRAG